MSTTSLVLAGMAIAGAAIAGGRALSAMASDGASPPEPPDGPPPPPSSSRGTLLLPELARAAFPGAGRPGAAVVIPPGYNASGPLDLLIYLHGHNNCVKVLVGDARGTCRPGGPVHNNSGLARQLVASGANALLIMPQLKFEERTGAAGALGRAGGLEALVDEILTRHTAPLIGARRVSDVRRVGLMCHSGGYLSTAAILRVGDFGQRVADVVLLDALYGESVRFRDWMLARQVDLFARRARFACVYTAAGGTRANAQALATTMARSVQSHPGALAHTTPAVADPADWRVPIGFLHSRYDHTTVSRYYPERYWRTGPWERRPDAPAVP